MLKRWINHQLVHAVHIRDLENNLSELGILEDIQEGHLRCFNCDSRVELHDIQCLFMVSGVTKICCSKTDCFGAVLLSSKDALDE